MRVCCLNNSHIIYTKLVGLKFPPSLSFGSKFKCAFYFFLPPKILSSSFFPPISVSQLCTNFPPILSVHLFLQVSWKRHRRLRCLRFRRSLHQNTYFPHFHFLHTRVLWRIIMFNYSFITYDNQGNKSMVRIVRIEHNTLIQQRREREREKSHPKDKDSVSCVGRIGCALDIFMLEEIYRRK